MFGLRSLDRSSIEAGDTVTYTKMVTDSPFKRMNSMHAKQRDNVTVKMFEIVEVVALRKNRMRKEDTTGKIVLSMVNCLKS